MENVSLIVAFSAGLFSFLSPCVLPLVPVYIGSLCGPEMLESGASRNRLPIFLHSLSFVVGFSVIFATMGAIAGQTGAAINSVSELRNVIAGSLFVAFGLFMLAALKVPWLNYEKRLTPSLSSVTGYSRSFLIGAAFAPAWTACVGPILTSILTIAGSSETAWKGASLLGIYSLGLGLPFLIIGAAFDTLTPLLRRIRRYSGIIYIIGAALLIGMGIVVLTNKQSLLLSLF